MLVLCSLDSHTTFRWYICSALTGASVSVFVGFALDQLVDFVYLLASCGSFLLLSVDAWRRARQKTVGNAAQIFFDITLNVTDMDMDRYTISVNRYAKELVTYMVYLSTDIPKN